MERKSGHKPRYGDLERDFAAAMGLVPALGQSAGPTSSRGPAHVGATRRRGKRQAVCAGTSPGDIKVTWGTHPFKIRFTHAGSGFGSILRVHIIYMGPLATVGSPAITLRASAPELATWCPRVRKKAPGPHIEIDPHSDGRRIIRLFDEIEPDPTSSDVQLHRISAYAGGVFASSAEVRLQYPGRHERDANNADDGKRRDATRDDWRSADQTPEMFSFQLPIDLDGDRSNELVLGISMNHAWWNRDELAKTVRVELTQRSSGKKRGGHFAVPRNDEGVALLLKLVGLCEGRKPLTFELGPKTGQYLRLFPPIHQRRNHLYPVEAAGQVRYLRLPVDRGPKPTRARASSEPGFVGGISHVDVSFGGFGDKFRITACKKGVDLGGDNPGRAIVGISPLYRGEPVSGMGIEMPVSRTPRLCVVEAGENGAVIDVDRNPDHHIHIAGFLRAPSTGGRVDINRDHRLRITSDAFAKRELLVHIRNGKPRPTHGTDHAVHRSAASNAAAVTGLGQQTQRGDFADQLLAADLAMMPIRGRAAEAGLIDAALFAAWNDLAIAMTRLRPVAKATEVGDVADRTLRNSGDAAERAARRLVRHLRQATRSHEVGTLSGTGFSGQSRNPYTNQKTDLMTGAVTSAGGSLLPVALARSDWDRAFVHYHRLVAGLDRWIVEKLRGDEAAGQAKHARARLASLGALERYEAIRIPAVFRPDRKFESESGYTEQISLELYCYRSGDTWFLADLTNPQKPYRKTVKAKTDHPDAVPPVGLFAELDDPDRFVVGTIHFEVPGHYGGQVRTTDRLTWQAFFEYFGLGLAAAGITLVTFGTGTVAVVGAWALAGSAVAGATAAGIDLHKHATEGDLDARTAVIDVAQIIAGLASAGAMSAGRLVLSATAGPISPRWATAWANVARLADRVYVPLTATSLAGEGVQLAAMTIECAHQYDAIATSPGSEADKRRARLRLLTQFAVTGGIGVLSIKSELPDLGARPRLVLTPGPDGIPVIRRPTRTLGVGGEQPQPLRNKGEPYADPRVDERLPRRYLDRRELEPVRRLDLQPSWAQAKRALKKARAVALGKKLKSAEEGHEVIAHLAQGDASALGKIGIDDYPADLDPSGREWALVQARDGFVIYAGKYGDVQLPTNVRPLAHNHPGPTPTAEFGAGRQAPTEELPVPEGRRGLRYDEIIDPWDSAVPTGITPSVADIQAITDGTPHVIYTRYVHRGGGQIDNPLPNDPDARVALHLSGARVVRWNDRNKTFIYEVNVQVKDSINETLWENKVYVVWYMLAVDGVILTKKPSILVRPLQPGWREP